MEYNVIILVLLGFLAISFLFEGSILAKTILLSPVSILLAAKAYQTGNASYGIFYLAISFGVIFLSVGTILNTENRIISKNLTRKKILINILLLLACTFCGFLFTKILNITFVPVQINPEITQQEIAVFLRSNFFVVVLSVFVMMLSIFYFVQIEKGKK